MKIYNLFRLQGVKSLSSGNLSVLRECISRQYTNHTTTKSIIILNISTILLLIKSSLSSQPSVLLQSACLNVDHQTIIIISIIVDIHPHNHPHPITAICISASHVAVKDVSNGPTG